ncbi:MAG: hypothetical protein ACM34A_01415 [Bacillota bacterium]
MRLHLTGAAPLDFRTRRDRLQDLIYTAMFVIGVPAVIAGSMYLVDALFDLLWH